MIYKGEALRNAPVFIEETEQSPYFELPVFIPDQKFVDAISLALHQGWPLLLTTDVKSRRANVVKCIAYELYGKEFLKDYHKWLLRQHDTFEDGVITYFHEDRMRDLEYHRLDPENSPIRPPDFYYREGPMLAVIKALEDFEKNHPILEISNVHEASPDFIRDLMDFMIYEREIRVPEIDFHLKRESYQWPIIIMTAASGYQLPKNYEGVIYTYEMPFPQKSLLMEEVLNTCGAWVDPDFLNEQETPPPPEEIPDEARLRHSPHFPQVRLIIEKLVELFYLIKDSNLLRPGNSQFPMTILELHNTVNYKVSRALSDLETIDEVIAEIDGLLESQYELVQSTNLSETVSTIKEAIEKAKMNQAIKILELIKGKLSADRQNAASQLIARHNDLMRMESMGMESSLILFPQKNKLRFDLLQFLDQW